MMVATEEHGLMTMGIMPIGSFLTLFIQTPLRFQRQKTQTNQVFFCILATIHLVAIQTIFLLALILKTWLIKLQKIGKQNFQQTKAHVANFQWLKLAKLDNFAKMEFQLANFLSGMNLALLQLKRYFEAILTRNKYA